jgi:hypothetical protein
MFGDNHAAIENAEKRTATMPAVRGTPKPGKERKVTDVLKTIAAF